MRYQDRLEAVIAQYLAPYQQYAYVEDLQERRTLQNELFADYNSGSEHKKELAECRLICLNIRFVLQIALGFKHKCDLVSTLQDLMQVGQMALCHAMTTFDVTRGFMLCTYAQLGIQREMERFLADGMVDAPIRVNTHRKSQVGKVKFAMRELANQGRPTDDLNAILEKINARKEKTSKGMTRKDVEACMSIIRMGNTSLNSPLKKDGEQSGCCLVDTVSNDGSNPEDAALESEANKNLRKRIARIRRAMMRISLESRKARRDVAILSKRYGLDGRFGLSLEEVGAGYGLSRERVRQIEAAMLADISQVSHLSLDIVRETLEAVSEGYLRLAA